MCRRQKERIDFENLEAWCKREGGSAAFAELMEHLAEEEPLPYGSHEDL